MNTSRMEAFSDGVIAIIITIMVLELKVPHGADLAALVPMIPKFLAYVLSFTYVGIYWNNHHHLLHATKQVSGAILWANLNLLFWLSMFPIVTAWTGENHTANAGDHCRTRRAVVAAARGRPRFEGQDLARAVCAGHRRRVPLARDCAGPVPDRGAAVADTRSAH
jgi:hypothetical protein